MELCEPTEEPGSATTSTFVTDSQGRVTRILGPVPAGIDWTKSRI